MKIRSSFLALLCFALVFAFTGCQSPASPPPASPISTALPLPSATASPTPTSTPTLNPSPTPTPLLPPISAETVASLSLLTTFGQGEYTRQVVFSPDSSILASVAGNTEDFSIRLWNVPSGEAAGVLKGHDDIVWSLAFSPDGEYLVSVSRDWLAKIWDWRQGQLLRYLAFPNEVTSVTFSPDGQTLAIGGVDQWPNAAVWTYSVPDWQPVLKLAEFWNIPDLAFTPDGQLLVGGGTSRNVRVWRASDGEELFVLYHPGQVTSIAISPDGATAATGLCEASEDNQCIRGAVWLWDLTTGTVRKKLRYFPDSVEGVAFSPDGSLLVATPRNGQLRAYSTDNYSLVFRVASPGGGSALAISPDGRMLATGRNDGQINLWMIAP